MPNERYTNEQEEAGPLKRSKQIALLSMGVSALALTACGEADKDAAVYSSVQTCIQGGKFTKAQCEKSFWSAKSEHAKVSPKYKTVADCEADFGKGKCETSPYRSKSGGSVFMPLMAGYMFGRLLSGRRGVYTQPLYRSRDDARTYRTADNKKVTGKSGLVKVPASTTKRPTSKLFTMRRGGFGKSGRTFGKTSSRSSSSGRRYRSYGG